MYRKKYKKGQNLFSFMDIDLQFRVDVAETDLLRHYFQGCFFYIKYHFCLFLFNISKI